MIGHYCNFGYACSHKYFLEGTKREDINCASDVAALDVDINPRYGGLNVDTQRIEPLTLPWIVAPAA